MLIFSKYFFNLNYYYLKRPIVYARVYMRGFKVLYICGFFKKMRARRFSRLS